MEANINGFNVEANPCDFGVCDVESQCKAKANPDSTLNYGYGAEYTIDTSKAYKVTTQFWSYKTEDLTTMDLQKIVTVLE